MAPPKPRGRPAKYRRPTTRAGLTPQRAAFAREYRTDLSAPQAAIRAGYSPKTARVIGYENLIKPHIRELIAEDEAKALAKADLSAQNVLEVIRRNVMRDIAGFVRDDGTLKALNELTPEQVGCIDKIVRDADGKVSYRIEGLDKWTEMAAKHFSLLTVRTEAADHQKVIEILNSTLAREERNAPRLAEAKRCRAERMKLTS